MIKTGYEKFFDLEAILKSIKEYLPKFDKANFMKAFYFGSDAHKGQFRKDGTTPYFVHPVEVVKILVSLHADEDTLISALLHDVPEDTSHDIDEIKALFGDAVSFLVDGITKLSKVHYQHNMPERQVESLKKLFLHSGKDLRVIFIKLADRLHNMKTMENIKDGNKRVRISTETIEIYVPIANLLGIQDLKSQLEDLCFKYIYPDEYEKLAKKQQLGLEKRQQVTDEFAKVIKEAAAEKNVELKIANARKNLYSTYKKIKAIGKNIEDIDDRVSIVILVKTIEDCYQVLGIVHGKFLPMNERFRDYIANPKANGYQSLHTTIFGVDGVLTEVQISTKKMHFDAQYGITSSFFNSETSGFDIKKYAWVNKILEIEKHKDHKDRFLEDLKLDILQDRIFTFSPKGTAVDLPKGAGVLDFAYAIHTDIGNHAVKADINGQLRPLNTVLKTGDVVNVICSRKASPELAWLSFIKTNQARNRVLLYLKKISKEKKIKEGHKILQKEFDIYGLGFCENINFKKLKGLLLEVYGKSFANLGELYTAIGEGEIEAIAVVKLLKNSGKFFRGLLSKKKEAGEENGIRVTLKILATNRFGLLKDLLEILYGNVMDMYSLKGWASKYQVDAFFVTEILVDNLETLSRIFDELQQVEEVISICRVSRKGVLLFTVGAVITGTTWIAHPFLLGLLNASDFAQAHPIETNGLVYLGLFVMIFMVVYLTNVAKKYFPFVRQRKLLWITSFSIPVLALIALFVELIYFQLKLSIWIILTEIVLIYVYQVVNYINFRKITRQI